MLEASGIGRFTSSCLYA